MTQTIGKLTVAVRTINGTTERTVHNIQLGYGNSNSDRLLRSLKDVMISNNITDTAVLVYHANTHMFTTETEIDFEKPDDLDGGFF